MYPSCVRSYKEHCNGCTLYVVCDVCKVFIKPCHKASVSLMYYVSPNPNPNSTAKILKTVFEKFPPQKTESCNYNIYII